jgi:hypothetical protein
MLALDLDLHGKKSDQFFDVSKIYFFRIFRKYIKITVIIYIQINYKMLPIISFQHWRQILIQYKSNLNSKSISVN